MRRWRRRAAVFGVAVLAMGSGAVAPAGAVAGPSAGIGGLHDPDSTMLHSLGQGSATVTNTGDADLHVSKVEAVGVTFPAVKVVSDCTDGPVAPGHSCTITEYVSPQDQADGEPIDFHVKITDDAADSPQTYYVTCLALHGWATITADGAGSGPYAGGSVPYGERTAPVVGTSSTGVHAWIASQDGNVYPAATSLGSMAGRHLNAAVVGIAAQAFHPAGGYWLVASDGGVFSFQAPFLGSMGGHPLNQPIVGMASTPDGNGYWLVAGDGGVFAFGDARFLGSMGGRPLNQPVVGMFSTQSGNGYWLVAADGGIFSFGDAPFLGSAVSQTGLSPMVGGFAWPLGAGYVLTNHLGDLFYFGTAQAVSTLTPPGSGVVGITSAMPLRSLMLAMFPSG